MIQIDYDKIKKEIKYINKTINEINSIEIIKNRIESQLSSVIGSTVTKDLLNGDKDILSLNNEQVISFLELLYKKVKDERLNPLNYKQTVNEINIANAQRKMYNPEFKEMFLAEGGVNSKSYSEETKRVARILFGKIGRIEKYNQQDIYEFNVHSFEAVLKELGATTIRSLQSSISTIEQYIDFAIKKEKISTSRGNVASLYSKKEDISRFLDKEAEENMIFSKAEIDSLSSYTENAQDGVILNLIFDGVSHKRKFVELRNIRIQDVNEDKLSINIPQLVDEDTGEILLSRTVPISSETLRIIKAAKNEDRYVSLKGKTSRNYKIAESDYILRGLRNNFQIKWENVGQRILRISDVEGYPYLNATNIAYSGQIHHARELMSKEGLTIDEACKAIMKRFNISENESAFFYLKGRIEMSNKIIGD